MVNQIQTRKSRMFDTLWAAGPAGGYTGGPTWLVGLIVIIIALAVLYRMKK